MADDIRKETENLKKEIEDASKELKVGFRKIIDGIAETNAPLAKTVAALRQQSKDTFAGALGAAKLKDISSQIEQFMSEGLDDIAFEKLQKQFDGIDLSEFKRISESAKALEDGIIELENARDQRIANSKVLQKKDAEIEERKQYALSLTGAALEAHMKRTEELERSREESYNRIAGGYEKEIEAQKALLEQESEKRNEYNEIMSKNFDQFAAGGEALMKKAGAIKSLTNGLVDIEGALDTVVSTVNDVGTLFGVDDLMGSIVGGFQKGVKALSAGIVNVGKSMMSAARAFIAPLVSFTASAVAFIGGLLATAASMLVAALPFIGIGLLVAAGVAAIVAGGMYLYEKFQENKELIMEKLGDFAQKVSGVVADIKDFFIGSFIKAKAGVSDFGDSISDMFSSFADFVSSAILSVREGLNKIGIGDADEIAAERKELEDRKKQRELAAAEREKESEARSNMSAIELARHERAKEELAERTAKEQEIIKLEETLAKQKAFNLTTEGKFADQRQYDESATQAKIDALKSSLQPAEEAPSVKPETSTVDTAEKPNRYDQIMQRQKRRKALASGATAVDKEGNEVVGGFNAANIARISADYDEKNSKKVAPVEEKQAKPMQRALGKKLTSEEVDMLSTEEQIKLGYAKVTGYKEAYVDEKGNKVDAQATFESTAKYKALLESEGVTSGGDFQGQARASVADSIAAAQKEATASKIKTSREAFEEENKQRSGGNVVSSVSSNNVNNVSNKFFSGRAVTGDRDTTTGKLNSIMSDW